MEDQNINKIAGGSATERVGSICPGDPKLKEYFGQYQNNYPDIPHPCPLPRLFPLISLEPSPLANGVFVPPACGKDDKTIGENDYG